MQQKLQQSTTLSMFFPMLSILNGFLLKIAYVIVQICKGMFIPFSVGAMVLTVKFLRMALINNL